MSNYPMYDNLVSQSKGVNTALAPIQTEPVQMTRDDIIANLAKPTSGIGGGTRWDAIKNSSTSMWNIWGINQFDNYKEWESWFMQEHPENIPLMTLTPKGNAVSVGTPDMQSPNTSINMPTSTGMPTGTSTMPSAVDSVSTPTESNNYMGQSIGGLANYLQAGNMPFGTMKGMGGTSNISPEVKAWRGKFSWE